MHLPNVFFFWNTRLCKSRNQQPIQIRYHIQIILIQQILRIISHIIISQTYPRSCVIVSIVEVKSFCVFTSNSDPKYNKLSISSTTLLFSPLGWGSEFSARVSLSRASFLVWVASSSSLTRADDIGWWSFPNSSMRARTEESK